MSDVDPRPLNVRTGPSTSDRRVDQLLPRQTFTVLDGPVCGRGFTWYHVSYDQGLLDGWIAESDDEFYFIDPVDAARPDMPPPTPEASADFLLSGCLVIVEDDFESATTASDWFIGRSSRSDVRIREGAYEIVLGDVGGDSTSWGSLRGIAFERATFEAVIEAPEFDATSRTRTGLWLRYQDETSFIAFMIQSDGRFRIAVWEDDAYHDLVNWRPHPSINTGPDARNTMRVEMVDDRYQLFINGRFAETVQELSLSGGRVAFFAASSQSPAVVRLDYFRACQN